MYIILEEKVDGIEILKANEETKNILLIASSNTHLPTMAGICLCFVYFRIIHKIRLVNHVAITRLHMKTRASSWMRSHKNFPEDVMSSSKDFAPSSGSTALSRTF